MYVQLAHIKTQEKYVQPLIKDKNSFIQEFTQLTYCGHRYKTYKFIILF